MNLDQKFLDGFKNYGIEGDNVAEIEWLELMPFEDSDKRIHVNSKLVLVLTEARVATRRVQERLERLKADLYRDGYRSRFIKAKLYRGENHRDGRCVLALRSFFQRIKSQYRNFKGVILVGDFPEAMLVRRCAWGMSPDDPNEWFKIGTKRYRGPYLMLDPEIVAYRTDIMLSDLTGHWDRCYQQGTRRLESIYALAHDKRWQLSDGQLASRYFTRKRKSFTDFFWLDECNYEASVDARGYLQVRYDTSLNNPEVPRENRDLPNPIATPDIFVSRINARHIAVNPDPRYRDADGKRYLARNGKPQAIESAPEHLGIKHGDLWWENKILETALLCDYLDRNHGKRTGQLRQFIHCATVAYEKDHKFDALAFARDLGCDDIGVYRDSLFDDATLLDYVQFLKAPVLVKAILAHSSARSTSFGVNYDVGELEESVGGWPWRWHNSHGRVFEPSFADQRGDADLYLHRTIYKNQVLNQKGGYIYIHGGCNVNSPEGAELEPYQSTQYGKFQNAEGILFFLKGLSVIARAKVFNDQPAGFIRGLFRSRTATVGDGYVTLFEDGQDASLPSQSNKRSYAWSILGDWTLRVRVGREPMVTHHEDTHAPGFYSNE